MTIFDELKIRGAWFEPDKPNTQVFGTLDGNFLEIFCNVLSRKQIEKMLEGFTEKIPIIYGLGEKKITLLNTILNTWGRKSRNDDSIFEYATYICDDVILGSHYQKTDTIKIIIFRYPFVWGPFHRSKKDQDFDYPYYKINIDVKMDDSTTLSIGQISESTMSILEYKTTYFEFFKIESDVEMSLNDMMEYLKSINCLLRLCIGKTIYPSNIKCVTMSENQFVYYPQWLLTYHQQNIKNVNPKDRVHGRISYDQLKNNFECIIQKWIQLWFKTPALSDFFNMFDSYVSTNTKFTEYTNILQRLQDSIDSQRIEFRKQIEWFLSFCSDEIKTEITKNDFIEKIIKTRNYHVHGTTKNPEYVIKDGYELAYLVNDLRSLIEIFLISQLPIIENKEIIQKKIFSANSYARKHPISSSNGD